MAELVFRFLIGGAVVSFFAVFAEIFRPKSFAGLFGAAPSIALATIGIAIAITERPMQPRKRVRWSLARSNFSLRKRGELVSDAH